MTSPGIPRLVPRQKTAYAHVPYNLTLSPRNLRPSYPKPHRRRAAGLASSLLECISIYTLFTFARPSGTSGTGIQGAGPIVIEASRTPLRASTA